MSHTKKNWNFLFFFLLNPLMTNALDFTHKKSSPELFEESKGFDLEIKSLLHQNQRKKAIEHLLKNQLPEKAKGITTLFLSQETLKLHEEGLNFAFQGKFHSAEDKLKEALKKEQDHLLILMHLGQLALLQNKFDEAFPYFQKALSYQEFYGEILFWLGRCYQLKKKLEESLKKYQEGFKKEADFELGVLWTAEIYQKLQEDPLTFLLHDTKLFDYHIHTLLSFGKYSLDLATLSQKELFEAQKSIQLALSRITLYEKKKKDSPFLLSFLFFPTQENFILEAQKELKRLELKKGLKKT